MGHYLGEMERDGVPRSMKADRGGMPPTQKEVIQWRREAVIKLAAMRLFKECTGRWPTDAEASALFSEIEKVRPAIGAIRAEALERQRLIREECVARAVLIVSANTGGAA